MGKEIALISRDNGVGLSVDAALMREVFEDAGHAVRFHDWREERMPHADIAFHLELVGRNLAQCAARNVAVLNLEWYPAEWVKFLPAFDEVWAKSTYAEKFCKNRGAKKVHYTGFLGKDLLDETVPRALRCMHLRGKSGMKGTDMVLAAWAADPSLPPLTVISKDPVAIPEACSGRVEVVIDPPDRERDRLMNACEIHVCPSIAEGWGHYIAEAMSVGAVVVTTDASPMNEHIRPEWGYLTGVHRTRNHHQAILTYTTPDLIGQAVRRAAALSAERRREIGRVARERFLLRNEQFRLIARKLVEL